MSAKLPALSTGVERGAGMMALVKEVGGGEDGDRQEEEMSMGMLLVEVVVVVEVVVGEGMVWSRKRSRAKAKDSETWVAQTVSAKLVLGAAVCAPACRAPGVSPMMSKLLLGR